MKALTSIIFKNEIRTKQGKNSSFISKSFAVLSFLIVFCSLAGFMTWSSIYITKKLQEINQTSAFINIMLAGNLLILFTESVFQVLNTLYFSKDLKVYLILPIKSSNIIHGKLLKLITSEYPMEIIMLAIPMIVYGILKRGKPAILCLYPSYFTYITNYTYFYYISFSNDNHKFY